MLVNEKSNAFANSGLLNVDRHRSTLQRVDQILILRIRIGTGVRRIFQTVDQLLGQNATDVRTGETIRHENLNQFDRLILNFSVKGLKKIDHRLE